MHRKWKEQQRNPSVPGLAQLHSQSPTEALSTLLKFLSKRLKTDISDTPKFKNKSIQEKKSKGGLTDKNEVLDHL